MQGYNTACDDYESWLKQVNVEIHTADGDSIIMNGWEFLVEDDA